MLIDNSIGCVRVGTGRVTQFYSFVADINTCSEPNYRSSGTISTQNRSFSVGSLEILSCSCSCQIEIEISLHALYLHWHRGPLCQCRLRSGDCRARYHVRHSRLYPHQCTIAIFTELIVSSRNVLLISCPYKHFLRGAFAAVWYSELLMCTSEYGTFNWQYESTCASLLNAHCCKCVALMPSHVRTPIRICLLTSYSQ